MSADHQAWLDRWRDGRIGFHLDKVNGYLARHADAMTDRRDARVFVPLCGKSLDLAWLAERGHDVVGVELAEDAVLALHEEQGLSPDEIIEGEAHRCYVSGRVRVFVGDFFALSPAVIPPFDAVWDRAAMIALPESVRPAYAAHLRGFLAPEARVLLSTLVYDQARMNGPPFSVSADEVRGAYEDAFSIERLEEKDITAENPRFAEAGLDVVSEETWLLTPR